MAPQAGDAFGSKREDDGALNRRSVDRRGLERQADLEHLDRIEGELRVEAALDVGGPAKAVLLA